MISFPNAKINLGLNVLRRRNDGFHDIRTVMLPIAFKDALEIIPSGNKGLEFSHSGIELPGDPAANLCVKAYRLYHELYPVPGVKMHLHKVIPPGSGLGGGSSDAAYTLKMLNSLFDTDLSEEQLVKTASGLGSDCPFFIRNRAVLAEGRGEVMKEIALEKLSGKTIVLVLSRVHVSTARAYSMISPSFPGISLEEILFMDIQDWKGILANDFEKPVFLEFPSLREIRDKLYDLGAIYASMSGSGSAIYGIFDVVPEDIALQFPGMETHLV